MNDQTQDNAQYTLKLNKLSKIKNLRMIYFAINLNKISKIKNHNDGLDDSIE